MSKRVAKAEAAIASLQGQMLEQRGRQAEAEELQARLGAEWERLCLAQDLDGADNAKAIADCEKRQEAAERQGARAGVVLGELERRLHNAEAELAAAVHEDRMETLRVLQRQEAELFGRFWKAAAVLGELGASIDAVQAQYVETFRAARESAKSTGLAGPASNTNPPPMQIQNAVRNALTAARQLRETMRQRVTSSP